MIESLLMMASDAVGNTPLDHGQGGPVVLILGGAAMLAVSLFLSLVTQRRNPRPLGIRKANHTTSADPRLVSHRPKQRNRRPGHSANTGRSTPPNPHGPSGGHGRRREWLPAVTQAAHNARLGTPVPLMTPSGRHGVQINQCRSCLHNQQNSSCERERRILEQALQSVAPAGEVVEIACTIDRPGICRFEIIPGEA